MPPAYLAVLGAAVLCYAALRMQAELVDGPAALRLLVGAPAATAVVTWPAGGRLADRVGAAAGVFFAFFDAGVGAGGPIAGGVARLSSPATALALAAGAVASSAVCGRAAVRAHRRAATCSA